MQVEDESGEHQCYEEGDQYRDKACDKLRLHRCRDEKADAKGDEQIENTGGRR
jgi:hypothetical protein